MVKRRVEVSLHHWRLELCRARGIIQQTRRGMHFAVVADKLDLSSTQRREKNENIILIVPCRK